MRTFTDENGESWMVEYGGGGHGVGTVGLGGALPPITSYLMYFTRGRDGHRRFGHLSKSDPASFSEDQLRFALAESDPLDE